MLGLVPGAFLGAGVARLGTQRTDGLCVCTAPGHHAGCQLAQGSAVRVHGNAAGHHLYVVFCKASRVALVAGGGAVLAGLDAVKVLVFGSVDGQAPEGGWVNRKQLLLPRYQALSIRPVEI